MKTALAIRTGTRPKDQQDVAAAAKPKTQRRCFPWFSRRDTPNLLPTPMTTVLQQEPTDLPKFISFPRNQHDDDEDLPYDEQRAGSPTNGPSSRNRTSRLASPRSCADFVRPAPHVLTKSGFRVTVVDWAYKIFVVDMLPPAVCLYMRDLCAIGLRPEQWRTLYTHTHSDCPSREVPAVHSLLKIVSHNVRRVLADMFRTSRVFGLHERSWKEPHLLKYHKLPGQTNPQTGVCMHHDGSDVTWSLMLSELHEYTGGGTYFGVLRRTVKLNIGQVLIHPGDLFHKGVDITGGERHLAVCFMDGFHPGVQEIATLKQYEKLAPQYEVDTLIT